MSGSASSPTFRQLQYFVAIAEHKTYRRAADILGISQPTLTAQIHALEATLQSRVLERSRAGAVLTPVGREVLVSARRVIDEMETLVDTANRHTRGGRGTYRLGVSPSVGPYLLPHILPELHQQYPELQFYVRESLPNVLEQELQDNSWLTIPADSDILFNTPIEQRWKKSAEKIGINIAHLSSDVGHA